jgi:hypothetical protein
MEPLALSASPWRVLFQRRGSLDFLRIDVIPNLDDYSYMAEQHISLKSGVARRAEKRYGRAVEDALP